MFAGIDHPNSILYGLERHIKLRHENSFLSISSSTLTSTRHTADRLAANNDDRIRAIALKSRSLFHSIFRQFIKQQKNSLNELRQLKLSTDRSELIMIVIYECVARDS